VFVVSDTQVLLRGDARPAAAALHVVRGRAFGGALGEFGGRSYGAAHPCRVRTGLQDCGGLRIGLAVPGAKHVPGTLFRIIDEHCEPPMRGGPDQRRQGIDDGRAEQRMRGPQSSGGNGDHSGADRLVDRRVDVAHGRRQSLAGQCDRRLIQQRGGE
jgi:hypothetical protein